MDQSIYRDEKEENEKNDYISKFGSGWSILLTNYTCISISIRVA